MLRAVLLTTALFVLPVPPTTAQVKAVIVGPKEAATGDLVVLDASQSSGAIEYRWLLVNSEKTFLQFDGGLKCVFSSGKDGEYIFVLVVAGKDNNDKLDVQTEEWRVVIGKKPDDNDDEVKPDPTPPPDPHLLPFKAPGFAFLILKEAKEVGSLPPSQRVIFNSSKIFQFANSKAVKVGDQPFYRIWDDDFDADDLADVDPLIQAAYLAAKEQQKSLPWILISNGKTGFSGPLPTTVDETLELLGRYAK